MNGLILRKKFRGIDIEVCQFGDNYYFYLAQIAKALAYARAENLYIPINKNWKDYFDPGDILRFEKKTAKALSLSLEFAPKSFSYILMISRDALLTLLAKSGKRRKHEFRRFLKREIFSGEISEQDSPTSELTIASFLKSKNIEPTPKARRSFGIKVAKEFRKQRKRDPLKVIKNNACFNSYSLEDLKIFETAFREWEREKDERIS